jgi:methylated-DNA-[protein]-cysteine S-methyltransferase
MFIQKYETPNGYSNMFMSSDGTFLTGLWFEESKDTLKHPSDFKENNLPIFDETRKWLDIYFSGEKPQFIPKYKINNLTPFRKQVIDIMTEIPYGKLISYNDIAKEIAKKNGIEKMSAQAVGGAVGWNPICLIIPCHRVIGANGNLTGYGGGIQNKIKLLELEKNDMNKFTIPKNR